MKLLAPTIAVAAVALAATPASAQSIWFANVFRQRTPEARMDAAKDGSAASSLPGAHPASGASANLAPPASSIGGPTYGNFPYLDPIDYCVARPNAIGCVPRIGWIGRPSATLGTGFTITCERARNQRVGLLMFGLSGPAILPFHGATLCVRPPLSRTPLQDSAGSATGDDCSGTFAIDFNSFVAAQPVSSLLRVPGIMVHAQWWSRDQASSVEHNTILSNALRFVIGM